jgi:hypothetical protein
LRIGEGRVRRVGKIDQIRLVRLDGRVAEHRDGNVFEGLSGRELECLIDLRRVIAPCGGRSICGRVLHRHCLRERNKASREEDR